MDHPGRVQRTDEPAGRSEDRGPPFGVERRLSEQAVSQIACIPDLLPGDFASIEEAAGVNRGRDHRRRQYPESLELGGEQQLVERAGRAESEKAIAGQGSQQSAMSQLSHDPTRAAGARDDVERSAALDRFNAIDICCIVDKGAGLLDGITQEIVRIVLNDDMATRNSCGGVTGNRGRRGSGWEYRVHRWRS